MSMDGEIERAKERFELCRECTGNWQNCKQQQRGRVSIITREGIVQTVPCKYFAEAAKSGEYKFDVADFPELSIEQARCVREQQNCMTCKGINDCRNPSRGMFAVIRWVEGTGYYPAMRFCDKYYEHQMLTQMQSRMGAAGVGKRFLNRTFETFEVDESNRKAYEKTRAYAVRLDNATQNGLLFVGNVGTGKTHLAVAALLSAVTKGVSGRFESVNDMVRNLGASYQTNDTGKYTEEIMDAPFLVLDDLGKEKGSETAKAFMFSLINHRYEGGLPTLITTNLTGDELKELYGAAICSRLYEMCELVVMTGSDRRRNK